MTQYDAGPGDWSDREWEAPDRKREPHAKRPRVVLPPWALLAIFIGAVVILCVGIALVVRAIRGGGEIETPTPVAAAVLPATATVALPVSTELSDIEPTPTVDLQAVEGTEEGAPTEIQAGAVVVVKGTKGAGLRVRAQPNTGAKTVVTVKDGKELTVLEGPQEAGGYLWWRVETSGGKKGWAAADWLELKTE